MIVQVLGGIFRGKITDAAMKVNYLIIYVSIHVSPWERFPSLTSSIQSWENGYSGH